jgi:hypothetical protein
MVQFAATASADPEHVSTVICINQKVPATALYQLQNRLRTTHHITQCKCSSSRGRRSTCTCTPSPPTHTGTSHATLQSSLTVPASKCVHNARTARQPQGDGAGGCAGSLFCYPTPKQQSNNHNMCRLWPGCCIVALLDRSKGCTQMHPHCRTDVPPTRPGLQLGLAAAVSNAAPCLDSVRAPLHAQPQVDNSQATSTPKLGHTRMLEGTQQICHAM